MFRFAFFPLCVFPFDFSQEAPRIKRRETPLKRNMSRRLLLWVHCAGRREGKVRERQRGHLALSLTASSSLGVGHASSTGVLCGVGGKLKKGET